jgi:multidrug transporter EmrE-like cation transporter
MNPTLRMLPLILVSVLLSAAAQLAFKFGMMRPDMQDWLRQARFDMHSLVGVPINMGVIGGLAMFGFSTCLWLFVLSRVNVSVAYPFVAIGFIATAIAGALVLGEPFTLVRVLGTVLIALGVVLVAT